MAVKFINYSGNYPNLCRGTLTVNIDGRVVKFGNGKDCIGGRFWISGGEVSFTDDWDEIVSEGDWGIIKDKIPPQFRQYSEEFRRIMNENVSKGCCGGCV